MKLLHTADWHLGQSFHGQERHVEHRAFLDWLLATLVERQPDALLIAGDIFDVVNPSLRAQELLYDFIVSAHAALPALARARSSAPPCVTQSSSKSSVKRSIPLCLEIDENRV